MTESTDSTSTSGARARSGRLKHAAADQIDEIADAIHQARARLDPSQPTLASYAARLADGVGGLASHVREDSMEDLYRSVRGAATRHPGMFLLGSAALGVALARFMRASQRGA